MARGERAANCKRGAQPHSCTSSADRQDTARESTNRTLQRWDGTPALMVETVEVTTRRFDEMDEDFVALQGEFRDLAHWRKSYRAYFSRNGGVSEDMDIICERFRVVEDYA